MALEAPTFVAAATAASGTAHTTTGSVTVPLETQPGDLLLLSISSSRIALPGGSLTINGGGWDFVAGSAAIFGSQQAVFQRRAQEGDAGSTVAFTLGGSSTTARYTAVISAYRPVADTAIEASAAGSDNGVAPSLTVSAVPGTLVCFWSAYVDGTSDTTTISAPAGMSVRVAVPGPVADAAGEHKVATLIADEAIGSAGPTGARAASSNSIWIAPVSIFLAAGEVFELNRVRSSVSEDAGSLFQATQAVAVELGLSEAFPYGEDVPAGELRVFREALTPDEVAVSYYPLPTRNQEMLTTVEGETNLGRLAHTIAPRIFSRGTSIPGNVDGVVTAQQAIQHVVNRWSSEHPWLVFEPIPDLRLLVPEAVAAPRQYYLDNPTAGVLTTSNVVIEQEGNERRTMREVLDEWLQIFPGTIVRQTSAGTIELVPRVGPDAPDGAALTLTWRDLARMSDGEDDPRGIYNRARVTSQGWDWSEDTPLLPPSYIFSADGNGLRRSVLESEEVMPSAREEAWPNSIISFAVLNDGTPVAVDLLITAFGSWSRTAASSFSIEGSAPHQFTLARGQRRDVSITHWTRAVSVTSRWRFERLAAPGPDVLYVTPLRVVPGAYNPFGSTYLAYLLEFDVTGMAWTKSNEQITSEFGQASDYVPAEGGGNALDQSRSLYGERTATINSTVFQLDSTQARQVSESFVLHNINPRTIRDVQQSEWNRYPVKFDHIGRYVELPNGEVAVVENRSYSDSFAPRASAMMSTFTATVSHSVIDTSTEYLFNSDGSYWENDDGTISEVL